jgi:DNA-binding CsgD family transcriptional regulator
MAKSTADRAEARFKQLCCLGLGGEAAMPALLNELRTIVPSYGISFFFADERGGIANVFDENPETPRILPLYLQEFEGRTDRELGMSFSSAMRGEFGVHDLEEVMTIDPRSYRRTDHYNLIMRPLGYDASIRLIVREQGRGRGLGAPVLFRSVGEQAFSAEEKRRLGRLESFFAHALTVKSTREIALDDGDRRGLIIANAAGKAIYASVEGRRLLFYATYPRTGHPGNQGSIPLPPAVVRLCRSLWSVFSGRPAAMAPVYHHRNIWGGFTFRAQWLEGPDSASGFIGITVSHEEPVSVKLVRRVGELPLSPRESEVCLLMANGESNEEIAERLGISRHTAIAHGRWIYNKLDVHNRAELVQKLLTTAAVH